MRLLLPQSSEQAFRPWQTPRNQKPTLPPSLRIIRMPGRTIELPKSGFALEIDGRLKTEFSTKEGADHGAIELKRRFPMLQIRIYDAGNPIETRFPGLAAEVHGPRRGRRRSCARRLPVR